MIAIPILLISAIDGSRRPLGTLVIANDGTAINGDSRHYTVTEYDDANVERRRGRVDGWASESRSVLELVGAAIASLGERR